MDFYQTIAQHYDDIFPVHPGKVALAAEGLAPGSRILDIGCATGAMSSMLGQKGFSVEGIDLSDTLLARAQEKAQSANVQFRKLDMRAIADIFPEQSFDSIACFGNTLVHLQGVEEIGQFLQAAYKCLKPGGKFVGQILNYTRILKYNIAELPEIDKPAFRFSRRYKPCGAQLLFQIELLDKATGKTAVSEQKLYPLTHYQLTTVAKEAGFNSCTRYGSPAKAPFDEDTSYPLLFVLTR